MQRRETKNKDKILNLFKKEKILSAKDISNHLPEIDFSTIFRNLKRFVDDNILREVNISADTVSYERAEDVHDHFVCDSCHKVIHIELDERKFINILPKNFEVKVGRNIFHGKCSNCY